MKQIISFIIIAFLMIIGFLSIAYGSHISLDGTWGTPTNDNELTYYIDNKKAGTQKHVDIIHQVIKEWESKLDDTIFFNETNSKHKAHIDIIIKNNIDDEERSGWAELKWRYEEDYEYIVGAEIEVEPDTDYLFFKNLVRHELGHSLGLGHSNDESDLMAEYLDGTREYLVTKCHGDLVLYTNWFIEKKPEC